MIRNRQASNALRYAISGVLAAGLLAGCAGSANLAASSGGAPKSQSSEKVDQRIAKAEAAVQHSPRDVAARAALADAYMQAGRLTSAATAFADARALGDGSPRTALSLALAQIGAGNDRQAVAVLDAARESIPASDLGLALALAGETSRGVAILADALRGGENTPKLRQNLAYAYALDGRWPEAKLMAAQDVPADRLDERIRHWATQGKPEDYQKRVAGLLGVPLRIDSGQPHHLALAQDPSTGAAETEFAALAPAPQPLSAYSHEGELPALSAVQTAPLAQPVQEPARSAPASAASQPAGGLQLASASGGPGSVSRPVVQALPARSLARDRAANASAKVAAVPVAAAAKSADGTHLVQLGSFMSEASARRAWKVFTARTPALKNHEMTITQAKVNGKNYWRVAAAGFDSRAARSMCSSVRSRGGACFAYAETAAPPGALPARGNAGQRMARR